MSTGKPLSGLSVHLRSWGAMALPANEPGQDRDFGEKMNRVLSDSHIYLLCRRPAFSFDPATFSWSENRLRGTLLCKVNEVPKAIHFDLELPLKENETGLELGPAPYREIRIRDEKGDCVRTLTAMGLSQHPDILEKDAFQNDLEVLYIGNVYEEGHTPVFERIRKNDPLQKLLSTLQQALPDDDIIVYAFQYLPYELVALFGRLKPGGAKDEPEEARFVTVREHPLTEHQKICLAEAGLIHYFKPAWQERGGKMMPSSGETVFQACERLDIAGLVIEISTIRSHFRLYTASSALLPHHMTIIDLADPADRAAFFSIKV